MDSYLPMKRFGGQAPEDHEALALELQKAGVTHVRDTRGSVHKMYQAPHMLNPKSVPLNTANATVQRLPYSRVESFGIKETS